MDCRVKPGNDSVRVRQANKKAGAAAGPVILTCLFRGQEPARAFSMKSVRSAFFQSGIAETFFSWISTSACVVR